MKSVYIKLEDALRIVEQVITSGSIKHTGKAIKKRLKELPAEDVERVKHGEWLEHFSFNCWHYECSVCDGGFATSERDINLPLFCQDCGSKMDLKEGAEE